MALSQPSRINYGRECCLRFDTADNAAAARTKVVSAEIRGASAPADTVVVFPPEQGAYPPPVRVAPAGFSEQWRLGRDADNLTRLCNFFDTEMGIESGTAQATFSAPPERPWDALPLEKRVDYLALYLRVAHNVCYYCAREFFDEDEMQFVEHRRNENLSRVKDDIFSLAGNHSADWYFTQGKNIFVHNTNSGAMLWHIRHSARYFKYYPKETVTNFISSFINSMSHIEE